MASKSKIYTVLILVVIGLVFLGMGCAGKNNESSPSTSTNTSSVGAPVQEATATVTSQGSTATAASQSISVTGSDTILPLAQAEAEEFMNESSNAGKSISVTGGGSGVGIAALIDGKTDIADASREITITELKNANDKGVNPVNTTIAYDGITVIVNPTNKISNLTFTQLRGIFNGSISNWKDVGGDDKVILLDTRDSSSGTYKDFQTLAMQGDNYSVNAHAQATTGGIVQEVAQNPNAIGYIGFAYLDSSTKALGLDKGNGPVSPTPETILSREYPLSRALYMYTNGEPSGLTKEFIDYILSDQGQKVVNTVGYIPLKK